MPARAVSAPAASADAALRSLLSARGVPPPRVDLAARCVQSLLTRAVRPRADGTVHVVTGDIPAMWLRDSAAQVAPLLALVGDVAELADLVAGVLRLQVEHVLRDPRANAFNAQASGARMRGHPGRPSPWVYERKYAVDSLGAPLALAWRLARATGSLAHVDDRFREAAAAIVSLWRAEQDHDPAAYRFRRILGRRRGSPSHRGRGAPVARTGMTWSGFRPSDDACVYGYHVPSNAFASVALDRLADLLGSGDPLAPEAAALAAELRAGISAYGVVDGVYAYEVDGLGGALRLDDANVPSLLSLPYLGFCAADDPVYRATRAWILSDENPTFARGRVLRGVGSTHTRPGLVWPLAVAMEGLTAGSFDEREDALRRLEASVTGTLLFHEAVDPSRPERFTRPWFSWADMLYVELVLASAGIAV